jgi:hypothetical protein
MNIANQDVEQVRLFVTGNAPCFPKRNPNFNSAAPPDTNFSEHATRLPEEVQAGQDAV